jgi:hypothetical protein
MPTATANKVMKQLERPALSSPDDLRLMPSRKSGRVDTFKLHLGAFAVGALTVIALWALTALEHLGHWPNRVHEDSRFGNWDRWALWSLLAWGALVGIHALITYLLSATSTAEPRRGRDHSRP